MQFIKNMHKGGKCLALIVLSCMLTPVTASAESDTPHPMTEKEIIEERAPLNLDELELEELLNYKKYYLEKIKSLRAEIDTINNESNRLLDALAAYDKQRIRITALMPQLIEHYAISTPLSTSLMAYAETIHNIYEDYKNHLTSLDTYKSYDFRIGIAYTSMMAQLAEYKSIYQQMQKDMDDDKTLLGQYQASLRDYYGRIEEIVKSKKMEEYYSLKQSEKELRRINEEIEERQ